MVNDVEKRWNDPGAVRGAARYLAAVLVVTAAVFGVCVLWASGRAECSGERMLCDTAAQGVTLLAPAVTLLLGGIGAFVQTFLVWRRGGSWPIWQGAGWFALVLFLAYLSIGGGALAG
ncbi:hypothetical protein [Nocardia sp. NPDC057227]|uniref:hypothetical protein n=1 Tax=Nocardia sp. NPDC057227 TaxID=3346056 RepID=UPI0036421F5D